MYIIVTCALFHFSNVIGKGMMVLATTFTRMARLQTKLARKICLRHEFSHEKCSEMFPDIFEP